MLGALPVIEILFFIVPSYEKIAHDTFFQNMVMAPSSAALAPIILHILLTRWLYLF